MYSGWVGDDDGSFEGMRGCLRKAIYSAWFNYANFGCDVGGYRDRGSEKDTFVRWAQMGSFMPLMENGGKHWLSRCSLVWCMLTVSMFLVGGGEHRPWMFDEDTVRIYRKFTVQHHRLSAYLHTTGANAVDTATSSMHPVDQETIVWDNSTDRRIEIVFPQPKTYSYRLGNDVLVHPVV
jgi:alpha-glucosidase (family GH31 glycosyl hydrolase)